MDLFNHKVGGSKKNDLLDRLINNISYLVVKDFKRFNNDGEQFAFGVSEGIGRGIIDSINAPIGLGNLIFGIGKVAGGIVRNVGIFDNISHKTKSAIQSMGTEYLPEEDLFKELLRKELSQKAEIDIMDDLYFALEMQDYFTTRGEFAKECHDFNLVDLDQKLIKYRDLLVDSCLYIKELSKLDYAANFNSLRDFFISLVSATVKELRENGIVRASVNVLSNEASSQIFDYFVSQNNHEQPLKQDEYEQENLLRLFNYKPNYLRSYFGSKQSYAPKIDTFTDFATGLDFGVAQ